MPSSITLTVSHLPTSTSFFLSALQPLEYVYRGRCDNTIGFGSGKDLSAPADFWITQEIPGVPAGAAHVAFNAPSRLAVQQFFTAALKAGGKFHGDPAVRDSSGYYSAAVIDFDGNSIEAVYRPTFSDDKENDVKSVVSNARSAATARSVAQSSVSRAAPTEVKSSVSRATPTKAKSSVSRAAPTEVKSSVSRAAPTEVKSSVSRAAPTEVQSNTSRAPPPQQPSVPSQAKSSGDIIESLMAEARNAANVAREVVERALPAMNTTSGGGGGGGGGNGETIVGTLLGVAAGAALHYAFTNNNNNNSNSSNDNIPPRPSPSARSATDPMPTQFQNYRAIEAGPSYYSSSPRSITLEDNEYSSTIRPARSHHKRRNSGSAISTGFGSEYLPRSSRLGDIKMIEGGSTTSKSSRRSGLRMIEPPPPPSASTIISTASSHRNGSISDPLPVTAGYARSQHSEAKSSHSIKTVIRTTEETVQRVSPPSTTSKSHAASSKVSTVVREPEEYSLPPSKATTVVRQPDEYSLPPSRATTVLREPDEYPLPPSRAGTWAGSSMASKAKSKSAESKHSKASKASKSSSKSKAKESVFDREVTPDDSISQISVNTSSTVKGSRR